MLRFRFAEFLDKLLLLVAMLVFLAIGLSSIRSSSNLDTLTRQQRPMLSEQRVNVPDYEVSLAAVERSGWTSPAAQSRGEKWIFDVFTPPVIYYNPVNQEFAVTPPEIIQTATDDTAYAFGLELIEVRRRPFRLQLSGYAGEPGNYVAYFKYLPTGELLLARPGKVLVEAGAKLNGFEVQEMRLQSDDSMEVVQKVGVAKIQDYESGEEIYLTNVETKIFSELEARLRSKDDGSIYLVREGAQVELQNGYYIVNNLSSDPPEAVITQVARDGSRRRSKLLTPSAVSDSLKPRSDAGAPASPFAIGPKIPSSKPNG